MLNLKAYGSMINTSKLEHTSIEKGSIYKIHSSGDENTTRELGNHVPFYSKQCKQGG